MKFVFLGLLFWPLLGGISHASERTLAVKDTSAPRLALVIGNAAYPGPGALKNPANDARDIGGKLKRLGFEVILRTDLKQKDMLRALTEFGDKVQPGTEALFFYAGHGMQVKGRNYLIPVDAEIKTESSVSSEAVDVDQLLDKLAPARLSMVILDACRNNPFERRFRGGGQGLAQINAPTGTLIAYATAPGKVAADGEGRNGLYTSELLTAMDVPGIKIEDVFKRVRANVVRKSGEAQTPWESSSLTGDFYFRGSPNAALASPGNTAPVLRGDAEIEQELWDSIRESRSVVPFEEYLTHYPQGRFVPQARILIAKLRTDRASEGGPAKPAMPEQDAARVIELHDARKTLMGIAGSDASTGFVVASHTIGIFDTFYKIGTVRFENEELVLEYALSSLAPIRLDYRALANVETLETTSMGSRAWGLKLTPTAALWYIPYGKPDELVLSQINSVRDAMRTLSKYSGRKAGGSPAPIMLTADQPAGTPLRLKSLIAEFQPERAGTPLFDGRLAPVEVVTAKPPPAYLRGTADTALAGFSTRIFTELQHAGVFTGDSAHPLRLKVEILDIDREQPPAFSFDWTCSLTVRYRLADRDEQVLLEGIIPLRAICNPGDTTDRAETWDWMFRLNLASLIRKIARPKN